MASTKVESPIVVLGYPRSGTSLVAGLIHLHGAWAGECRQADGRNPKGFFENKEINRNLTSKKHDGPKLRAKIEKIVLSQGYVGGPWVVKHAVPKWISWLGFPDVKWVCCFRDPDEIYESHLRVWKYNEEIIGRTGRWWRKEKLISQAKKHQEIMTFILNKYNGIDIHPAQLTKSFDTTGIGRVLEFCGFVLDEEIVKSFVDMSLWNRGDYVG